MLLIAALVLLCGAVGFAGTFAGMCAISQLDHTPGSSGGYFAGAVVLSPFGFIVGASLAARTLMRRAAFRIRGRVRLKSHPSQTGEIVGYDRHTSVWAVRWDIGSLQWCQAGTIERVGGK